MGHVGEIDRHLDDPAAVTAARSQHPVDIGKGLFELGRKIPCTDDRAILVDRRLARQEQQSARLPARRNRIGIKRIGRKGDHRGISGHDRWSFVA